MCVPAPATAAVLESAAGTGIRAALVCSGGFAEAGPDGAEHQQRAVTAAREANIALLGPNTSGFIVPASSLTASFVPTAARVPAGPVAVVAASGGVNHALAFLLTDSDLGVSLAVGLGNCADVTSAEVLHHLGGDQATQAIALHVEAVTDGSQLIDAVRTVTATKPIVALVVGRSDVGDFARSHTGALATSWRATRAALSAAGAVLVDDERALVDAVTALSAVRLPPGRPGVGIVTAQAGPGLLHTDGLRSIGVSVPALAAATETALRGLLPPLTYLGNPVDTGRPDRSFGDVAAVVAADPAVDLLSVYALSEPDVLDLSDALGSISGPVVVGVGGTADDLRAQRLALREVGIPAVGSPAALTAAVAALVADAAARGRPAPPRPRPSRPVDLPDRDLDEHEAKQLLSRMGIATPRCRACADRDAARQALRDLDRPVAVKLLDRRITHKTEVGGVHLGVTSAEQLETALDALDRAGAPAYLLETMAPGGVDLIAGARRDPVFGPMALIGLGGTGAEAIGDVALTTVPVDPVTAGNLVDQLAGRAVLEGHRGGPILDRSELGELLACLGDLLWQDPRIESVEINPLRLTASGLIALDALVIRTERTEP